MASEHGPTAFERISYYNGITGNDEHPILVYRTDALTRPFSKPVGRFPYLPIKSVRGVFGTPLNKVWDTVGPQICDIIKARDILWSSIDTARFFTRGPPGEEDKGTLGPVVIWIGVKPGLTSADTAHNTSQEILALLRNNGVEDVEVEWREAVLQKLAGPPLMCHVESRYPTHHVRRFLTPLHAVPLATEGMETEGTLTLWMHETKDEKGNPSDKVYGISNCHVLRKDTTIDYEFKSGAFKDHVRVCGVRRFQRGLDEITNAIEAHECDADVFATEVIRRQTNQSPANAENIAWYQDLLDEKNEAITELDKLHVDITKDWSNMKLQRNIGHVEYAPAIKVDQKHASYTSDWGAFLAAKAKVVDGFVGNVVDLGSKFTPVQLKRVFYPRSGSPTTFKYPAARMLRIIGCATREELATPAEFDNEGERCLMVGKDGNATDLTVGRYSGLESFIINEVGIESRELAIYNAGNERSVEAFAAKGDSGSLVWHMKDGKAYIVGQLHSGNNRGGSTRNHVTYCTPGWYLLAEIKKKYKYADFYRTTWDA